MCIRFRLQVKRLKFVKGYVKFNTYLIAPLNIDSLDKLRYRMSGAGPE